MALKSAEQTNLYYCGGYTCGESIFTVHIEAIRKEGAEGINFNLKAGKIAQVGV